MPAPAPAPRRHRLHCAVAGALAVAALCPLVAGAQPDFRARRTREAIILDGRLTEALWAQADSITDFRQRDPREGAPATERTVVRLLATPAGLAVGWWCYDRDPARIVRSQLRRDAELRSDDYVSMSIDGLHDRRSGFYFRSNANGALWDGEHVSFEQGNEEWDGVWDARGRVTDQGYEVEMLIPWATLRYPKVDSLFGMNFRRFMPRKNEEMLWRGWRRTEGFRFLEREGMVAGFDGLPARPRVELRPYSLGEVRLPERVFPALGGDSVVTAGRAMAQVGADLKVPVTNTLTADLTFNPDFAQAEADRQIVNLTRFPLFFPEQRPFFTEGQAIFDFGRPRQTQLFYSRRIGLGRSGVPDPIPFGLRMQGRAFNHQVGVLAVRTGGAAPSSSGALRVKHDVLGRGFVGAMATYADAPGRPQSVAGGVDFTLPYIVQGGQNLLVIGNAAWSRDSAGAPVGGHYRLMVDYPNDNADIVVRMDRVEAGFNPALGFVQQRGIHRLGGNIALTPRPRQPSIIRRYEFNLLQYDVVWGLDWRLANAALSMKPLGVQFQRGDRVELQLQRQFDAPTSAFALFPGASIAPGGYWWNRAELQYTGAEARPVRWTVNVSAGGFYRGRSVEASTGLRVRRSPHLLATLDLVRTAVTLPEAAFTAQTVRLRTDWAFSPRLNTTLFAQWDNQSDRASVNARLRWTVRPGSDLFVVWNSAWPTGLERPVPWLQPARGGLVAKYVYFFRG